MPNTIVCVTFVIALTDSSITDATVLLRPETIENIIVKREKVTLNVFVI